MPAVGRELGRSQGIQRNTKILNSQTSLCLQSLGPTVYKSCPLWGLATGTGEEGSLVTLWTWMLGSSNQRMKWKRKLLAWLLLISLRELLGQCCFSSVGSDNSGRSPVFGYIVHFSWQGPSPILYFRDVKAEVTWLNRVKQRLEPLSLTSSSASLLCPVLPPPPHPSQ